MIAAWRWPYLDVAAQGSCDNARCVVPAPNGRTLWVGLSEGALVDKAINAPRGQRLHPLRPATLRIPDVRSAFAVLRAVLLE